MKIEKTKEEKQQIRNKCGQSKQVNSVRHTCTFVSLREPALRACYMRLFTSVQKGKGKGKGQDTCYSATYMSGLVSSSALQSRKWQLIGTS